MGHTCKHEEILKAILADIKQIKQLLGIENGRNYDKLIELDMSTKETTFEDDRQ